MSTAAHNAKTQRSDAMRASVYPNMTVASRSARSRSKFQRPASCTLAAMDRARFWRGWPQPWHGNRDAPTLARVAKSPAWERKTWGVSAERF